MRVADSSLGRWARRSTPQLMRFAGLLRLKVLTVQAARAQSTQSGLPRKIFARQFQAQKLSDQVQSGHADLADQPDQLVAAGRPLAALYFALADSQVRAQRFAAANGKATNACRILRQMRYHLTDSAHIAEAARVLGFPSYIVKFGREHRRRVALEVRAQVGIALRVVRVVAALIAPPVSSRPASVRAILAPRAPVAGPCLDQRFIHAEPFALHQGHLARHLQGRVDQLGECVVHDQAVAVLLEHRVFSHRLLKFRTDESAEEQVLRELLDRLLLAAHAEVRLQQHRAHELLPWDDEAAFRDVRLMQRRELSAQLQQRLVEPVADLTRSAHDRQQLLETRRREQRFAVSVSSSP